MYDIVPSTIGPFRDIDFELIHKYIYVCPPCAHSLRKTEMKGCAVLETFQMRIPFFYLQDIDNIV
jgi:hypothetical protein